MVIPIPIPFIAGSLDLSNPIIMIVYIVLLAAFISTLLFVLKNLFFNKHDVEIRKMNRKYRKEAKKKKNLEKKIYDESLEFYRQIGGL